ncbi:hypothetical protein TGARI_246220B, partial [Toxoplasma gondii ARI]
MVSSSWQDFYRECGQKSQLGNPLQAAGNFREHFLGKTVKWEGLVKQVKEGTFSSNFLFLVMYPTMTAEGRGSLGSRDGSWSSAERGGDSTLASLLMEDEAGEAGEKRKADARQEEDDLLALDEENRGMRGDGADLAFAFSEDLNEKVAQLVPGDKVAFEATLVELGRRQEGKPSLGRLWAVSVLEKWEERKKRLREKAEEESTFLQRLFPSLGSPFGGFSPLSLMGSLGGRGVIIVRRQVIASDSSSPFASAGGLWSSSGGFPGDDESDGVVRVVDPRASLSENTEERGTPVQKKKRSPDAVDSEASSDHGRKPRATGEGSIANRLAQSAPTLFGLMGRVAGDDENSWENLVQKLREERTEGKGKAEERNRRGEGAFAAAHDDEEEGPGNVGGAEKRVGGGLYWGNWEEDYGDVDEENEGESDEAERGEAVAENAGQPVVESKPAETPKTPEEKKAETGRDRKTQPEEKEQRRRKSAEKQAIPGSFTDKEGGKHAGGDAEN